MGWPVISDLSDPVPVAWDPEELVVVARLYKDPDVDRPQLWNGFVCPAFDRAEAQKIIDTNDRVADQTPGAAVETFSWDGDALIVRRPGFDGDPEELERLTPIVDDQGVLRWAIGAWEWVWSVVPRCPHCHLPIGWGALSESVTFPKAVP